MSTNPYAPPPAPVTPPVKPVQQQGVWRDGNLIIAPRYYTLPTACVMTGAPNPSKVLTRSYSWHSPMIYLTILAGLLIYVILALVLRKDAKITFHLSPEAASNRSQQMMIWLGVTLAGLGLIVGGIAGAVNEIPVIGILFLVGILVLIAGAVMAQRAANVLTVRKIDDRFIWLSGAGEEFLRQLPSAR